VLVGGFLDQLRVDGNVVIWQEALGVGIRGSLLEGLFGNLPTGNCAVFDHHLVAQLIFERVTGSMKVQMKGPRHSP
jgi:hypothetical protein